MPRINFSAIFSFFSFIFLSAFVLLFPFLLPVEVSAQNDIFDKGFIGANGCVPTESELDEFMQSMKERNVQLDDFSGESVLVYEPEHAQRYIHGTANANVVKGNKAFFASNRFRLERLGLFSTLINVEQSDFYTNHKGAFKIPVDNYLGVFVAYLSSKTIKAFNDAEPASNVSCYLANGMQNCFDKTNITSRYDLSKTRNYDILFNSTKMTDIATFNAYYHTLKAEQWATQRGLWPATRVEVHANFFPFCNAQFFPVIDWILLGQESTWTVNNQTVRCANTGYSTIVQHEYGHAFLNSIIGYPIPASFEDPNAYHEGIADTFSGFSLNEPCLGEDLFGVGSGCFRNIDDDFVYPVNSTNVHDRGRPLSGAFWDMRKQLIQEKGYRAGSEIAHTLFVETAKAHTLGLGPSIRNILLEQDTIHYNSRHHQIINNTFSAHGL